MYRDSFLSPSTKRLLFHPFTDHSMTGISDDTFLINFENLDGAIIQLLIEARFGEALSALTPLIVSHTSAFRCYSTSALAVTFSSSLGWLSDPAEFIDLHGRLPCPNANERLLLLLRLTSLLEFSLGNLYWTPMKKCGNMMKEVLNSPILENLCGRNCILLLRLFFGPVTSMNLRNLAWHGFVSASDMDQVDETILTFIFVLIMSIGQRLNGYSISTDRPSCIVLLESCSGIPDFNLSCTSKYFLDTVEAHPFAHCSSWAYVRYIDVLLNSRRYVDMLCLSLVCLSILLRHEYAEAMDCVDLCCSSESRFFLTIDCILQFKTKDILQWPGTILHYERFLKQIRNTRALAILCDLLTAESGPRLKDHLSHGEMWIRRDAISFDSLDNRFKQAALIIYTCFLALLSGRISHTVTSAIIGDHLKDYTLRYHPTAIFFANWCRLGTLSDELARLAASACSQEIDILECQHLSCITVSWFPDQDCKSASPSLSQLAENLWTILSVWALLDSHRQDLWCSRPPAVLNRLNIVVEKFNKCTLHLSSRLHFFSAVHLGSSLSAKKKTSLELFHRVVPRYMSFVAWLRNFLILCWNFWVSGLDGDMTTRLGLLRRNSHNLSHRAQIIDDLDRAADKLLMWGSKSLWESFLKFLESPKLATPRPLLSSTT